MIRRPETLPELGISNRRLSKPLAQMKYTALVSRWVMDIGGSVYVYSVLKLLSTVEQAEHIREIYEARGMSPEAEASYRRLTADYMNLMEAIPRHLCDKLLAELQQIPDLEREGWLSKLLVLLKSRT